MNAIVYIALLGWFFVVPAIFLLLPPRRAVLAAFLIAWLFLPVGAIYIGGLPNIDKMWMTSMGALAGVLIFDAGRLTAFRPKWYDLAIVALCFSPLFSSLSNGLGVYDGLSSSFEKSVNWGLPWLFGRLYFNDLTSLRDLAIGIVIGGLIYVPLCLYEVRMSPQLHNMVYGYFPHVWAQTKRFDGWRPQVFMPHGLALGFWMAMATLVCIWLRQTKSLLRIAKMPVVPWAIALFVTTVLCKSVNGWGVLAIGLCAMVFLAMKRTPIPRRLVMAGLIAIAPVYMTVRTTGIWQGEVVVPFVETFVHPNRARSLEYRLEAEELLIDRAMERPVFGWGGWGRHRVISDEGYDLATTDGQWIIQFGKHGIFGLIAWASVLLLPAILVMRRLPPDLWPHPLVAPTIVLAVVLALYAVDSLLNAMPNPIFVLTTGGLAACGLTRADRRIMLGYATVEGNPTDARGVGNSWRMRRRQRTRTARDPLVETDAGAISGNRSTLHGNPAAQGEIGPTRNDNAPSRSLSRGGLQAPRLRRATGPTAGQTPTAEQREARRRARLELEALALAEPGAETGVTIAPRARTESQTAEPGHQTGNE